MKGAQIRVVSKIEVTFHAFDPSPVKTCGGVVENVEWKYRVYSTTEPVVYIGEFEGWPLHSVKVRIGL